MHPTTQLQSSCTASTGAGNSSPKSSGDWAHQIAELAARDRSAIRDLASVVYAAKRQLHRGEWTALWKSGQVPFSKRKGEMLAAIGKGLGTLNAQTFAHLPPGWSILYQLSQLDRETLERHIDEGRIHPRLTLLEAKELVLDFKGCRRSQKSRRFRADRRIKSFAQFVRDTFSEWSPADGVLVRTELARLLQQIAEKTNGTTFRNTLNSRLLNTRKHPQSETL